ncbi:hypothetical protein H8356DRAFT_1335295 [Neocallimastix lanati (nom. inval.)]|nr:hypothetical protein H8356DRAFT_1335295 [Neocallimastix sp. JGI-2020a]
MFYTNTKFTNDTSTILHLQSFANDLVDTQIPIQHANRVPLFSIGNKQSSRETEIIQTNIFLVLSGLSRQKNMPATLRRPSTKYLLSTQHFVGNEEQAGALTDFFFANNGDIYFLIEVSSDMSYNFNNGNVYSGAELAVINFNNSGILSIPYPNKNWYFLLSFPLYVVYERINGEQVSNCGHTKAHLNFHEAMPDLPIVQ